MDFDKELLKEIVTEPDRTRRSIVEKYGISEQSARGYIFVAEHLEEISSLFETDDELREQSVRSKKQQQKFQDINRVERKSFREYARIENAIDVYTEELIKVFKDNPVKIETHRHDISNKAIGVFQISDTHCNELVEIDGNRYDFIVASKRMQKYVDKAVVYFKSKGIGTVLVALTADLLNSDRRLEELLSNATNRSKATFLAVQILENVIIELNQHFNVSVASVTGNESRVGKDVGWQHQVASDNYDLAIYRILEYHLKDKDGITFVGGDSLTKVVNICGYNWLLIHGHQNGFNSSITQAISKLVRLYSDKGLTLRFVIFGHIHEALIGDMYARSSSLVGSNSYSEGALMLTSRASQNIHIQYDNGEIDSIKIDLQEVDGYDGYPIQRELEAYNAKSASKAYGGEVVFKIVI